MRGGTASRNAWLLGGVAVGFALLQLAIIGGRSFYTHDEVVYLSQLNPAVPAYHWDSHRSLGMPILVAPVAILDAPVLVLRSYLAALSSLGLFLAYRPWLGVRDTLVVPVAAALSGTSYLMLHQATLALPNFYTALGAVAATGYFVRCGQDAGSRGSRTGLAVAIAVTALLRPSDSFWLVLPFVVVWLAVRAWRRLAVIAAVAAGLLAGGGVWAVEAFARFGGPLARMEAASHAVGGGFHLDLVTIELYARMWSARYLECYLPRGGGVPCELPASIQPVALAWVVVGAGFGALALAAGARRRRLAEVAIPVLTGLSLAGSYFFMLRYGAVRFLLPAGAVLAVPVAYGVLLSVRARWRPLRPLAAALAAAVVVGQLPLHPSTAPEPAGDAVDASAYQRVLAQRLRTLGFAAPCLVSGDHAYPVSYRLGCGSPRQPLHPAPAETAPIARARAEGESVAVILERPPPAGSFLDRWRRLPAEPAGERSWLILLPPPQPPPGPGNPG